MTITFKYKPNQKVIIIRKWDCDGYSNIWLSPHTKILEATIDKCHVNHNQDITYSVISDGIYYNNIAECLIFLSKDEAKAYLAEQIVLSK